MSFGTHHNVGDVAKREAQYNAAIAAAGKGFLTGALVATPIAVLANRRWAPFQRLTPAIKTWMVISTGIVVGVIRADKAGIAFDQEHYNDRGAAVQRRYQSEEERQWEALSTRDKALTWAKENKFGVVAGSWVTSLGLTFAYIQTQPLSFAQKLVQARVWAQGLTLASLIGMAAITQIPSEGDKLIKQHKEASEHSWKDFVGDLGEQTAERKGEGEGKGKADGKAGKPKEQQGGERNEGREK